MAKAPTHIKHLVPDPKNARRHNPRNIGLIEKSMNEVGAARSIVIDENNTILAGNGAVDGAAAAGITKVLTVDVDGETLVAVRRKGLTPEQKIKLAVADNRATDLSEFDPAVLAEIEAMGAGLLDGMFTDKELAELMKGLGDPDPVDAEPQTSKAEELNRKWKVKTGDVWTIGGHVLHCGDCRDIVPTLGRFDLLLTDPPYGIGRSGNSGAVSGRNSRDAGGARRKAFEHIGAWDNETPDADTFALMFAASDNQIIWGGNYFTPFLPPSMRWLVWDKGQRINQSDGELAYTSYDCALRIYTLNRAALTVDGTAHPTQKPVELMRWCIALADKKGDVKTILDPFAGSGTTMLAAENLSRVCTAIEREPTYCAVILDRMQTAFPALPIERITPAARTAPKRTKASPAA